MLYCNNCKKLLNDDNFYKHHKIGICKKCLRTIIDPYEPNTFLWLLEKVNVPYVESEWSAMRNRVIKRLNNDGGVEIFGKYLSLMNLFDWRNCHWEDTAILNNLKQNERS